MDNFILDKQPDWRYCRVRAGEKKPYPANWQSTPLELHQVDSENIGLLLGPASGGVCAIDFDGPEAIDHFYNTFPYIDITNIDTAMWTSGKEYRFQAAFTVPNEYWQYLKRKVVNKLEFRWTNTQSILPPSKLNDGRQYTWIKKPSEVGVRQIPDDVLAYWLKLMYDELTKYDNVEPIQYDTDFTDEEINELLSRIKNKVGELKGDYDVWRTIAWATCSEVGVQTAEMLMKYYWPYKTNKEIHTLRAWKSGINGPKLGTLIKLSGVSKDERKLLEVQSKMRKLKNGNN